MDNGKIRSDPSVAVSRQKAAELSVHQLQLADIVAARRGEIGRCALVTERETGWLCGTGSLRIRLKPRTLVPAYLVGVLSTPVFRETLSLTSVGSTMDNISAGVVSRLRLALPPYAEQAAMVNRMKQACDNCGVAIDRTRREI
jgi:type I restriction enzyme S subunit